MSVYTPVDQIELEIFLRDYTLGQLLSYAGIEEGIENTNYMLCTTQGDFVLTVFEWFTEQQLGYFLRLLQHLQSKGFPCPEPQTDKKGMLVNILASKPAAIFKRIAGTSVANPAVSDCQQIGSHLAQLHSSGETFPVQRANEMDLPWCSQRLEKIKPRLTARDYHNITAELEFQASYRQIKMPQGLIHGDLFKDNVLFANGLLTGVLDFYNACHDNLLIDLAITANDWCHELDGEINREKLKSLLESYQQVRMLTPVELQLLPVMLRGSALRFWISRLEHQLFPRAGEMIQEKDPLLYRTILEQHQALRAI